MENPFKDVDRSILEDREKKIELLRKNRIIQKFLKQYHQDFRVVEENSADFIDWLGRLKQCDGCPGLNFCCQPVKGRAKTLSIDEDGYLQDEFVLCKYAKEFKRKTAFLSNYLINHVEDDCRTILFDDLTLPKGDQNYAIAFDAMDLSRDQQKGIFLYGQPGTGKSYLASALMNSYASKGLKVSFVKVPQLIQELKQNIKDSEFRQKTMHALQKSDVLVLDDIGSEAVTAWTRDEILFPILDYRMSKKKKTYFTSNYKPKELMENYLLSSQKNGMVSVQRLMERIRTLSLPVELAGKSRRN